jgi:hypothetical protein
MHEMMSAIAHRDADTGSWDYWTYWDDGTDEDDQPEYFLSTGMGEVADEPVALDDLPTSEEEQQSWAEYARYVMDTGDDPLSNYNVDRTVTYEEAWQAHYERTPDNLAQLTGAMRLDNARWLAPDDLPADIKLYFDPAGLTFAEFAQRVNETDNSAGGAVVRDVLRVVALKAKRSLPVPEETVAQQLREAARQHLESAQLTPRS